MKDEFKIYLKNLVDTKNLAKKIAKIVLPKSLILIRGKLGVGKTTLAKYLINTLSQKKINVPSPSFPIVNTYEFPELKIWHYDLYRLKKKNDIFELDIELALMDCVIIEWPEIVEDLLPEKRIDISIEEDNSCLRFAMVSHVRGKSDHLRLKL